MEACLEEMRLANEHLENIMAEVQERLLEEGRAVTREKTAERIRAKLPQAQKRLEQVRRDKEKEAELDARQED